MSWNAGAGLFGELIHVTQRTVPDEDARREIYEHMLDAFVELDWEDCDECLGVDSIYDEVYAEKFPGMIDEDEEEQEELEF